MQYRKPLNNKQKKNIQFAQNHIGIQHGTSQKNQKQKEAQKFVLSLFGAVFRVFHLHLFPLLTLFFSHLLTVRTCSQRVFSQNFLLFPTRSVGRHKKKDKNRHSCYQNCLFVFPSSPQKTFRTHSLP